MAEKREKRRGKAAFVLILAAAIALYLYLAGAMDRDYLEGILSQTVNVDEYGYVSDYDALIGWGLTTDGFDAREEPEADAHTTPGTEREGPIAPKGPEKPGSAR